MASPENTVKLPKVAKLPPLDRLIDEGIRYDHTRREQEEERKLREEDRKQRR